MFYSVPSDMKPMDLKIQDKLGLATWEDNIDSGLKESEEHSGSNNGIDPMPIWGGVSPAAFWDLLSAGTLWFLTFKWEEERLSAKHWFLLWWC